MKFVYRDCCIAIGLLLICTVGTGAAEKVTPRASNGEVEVYITDPAQDSQGLNVQIKNLSGGGINQVALGHQVREVDRIQISNGYIFITGSLGKSGLEKIVCVEGDTGDKSLECDGRNFSYSPNERWIAYESFYPVRPSEEQVFPTINIIDTHIKQREERIVFPGGGYGKLESPRIKKWFSVSPIFWKQDSDAFCLLSRYGWFDTYKDSELHLIVVALDENGKSSTRDMTIDRELFANKGGINALISGGARSLEAVSFDRLRVTYGGGAEVRVVDIPFSWK